MIKSSSANGPCLLVLDTPQFIHLLFILQFYILHSFIVHVCPSISNHTIICCPRPFNSEIHQGAKRMDFFFKLASQASLNHLTLNLICMIRHGTVCFESMQSMLHLAGSSPLTLFSDS